MGAKEIVADYYSLTGKGVETARRLLHDDVIVQWHSSKGFLQLDKKDIVALAEELDKSYSSARLDITHMLQDGNNVTVRYTHYVNAFENPNEEMVLAHFVVIWEVQDGQLYKGWLMSQLG
jgi:predicted SnoaL-like aldol condensation-catalyzing enzyme